METFVKEIKKLFCRNDTIGQHSNDSNKNDFDAK